MVTGPPRNPRAAMDHRFAARRRRPGQLHRPHQPGCRGTTVAEGVQPLAGGAWPLFSAFFWSYSLLQVPGGLVLDRLAVMRVGRWG